MPVNRRIVEFAIVFINIALNFTFGSDVIDNSVPLEVTEHKKTIYKCCPKTFIVFNEDCHKEPEGINLNFSDVDVYTNDIDKTGFSVNDVFQMEVLTVPINETGSYIADFFLTAVSY